MSDFGPPGGGSREPWGGRRPDDGYGPPADPRYDPGYAPAQPDRGYPPPQPGGWGEPPAQRYEPTVGWDTGQPAGARGYPGYPPADPGYPEQPPYRDRPHHADQPHYADQPYHPGRPYPDRPAYPEQPPHAGQPAYPGRLGDAEPAPPKRGRGPLVAVLVVLVVLALGGAGAYWVLGRDAATVRGSGAPAGAADPTAGASGPAVPATTAPAPASSTDSRFVKAGQCVRNESADGQDPKLVITECGPRTYQVLRRIDGATSGKKDAEAKCAKVAGYTDWYFFDSELDDLDFVLCLKRR